MKSATTALTRLVRWKQTLKEREVLEGMVVNKKPWYLSLGVWGSLTAGVATAAAIFGYEIDVTGLATQIVTLVAAGFALYGRVSAKSLLTIKKEKK